MSARQSQENAENHHEAITAGGYGYGKPSKSRLPLDVACAPATFAKLPDCSPPHPRRFGAGQLREGVAWRFGEVVE